MPLSQKSGFKANLVSFWRPKPGREEEEEEKKKKKKRRSSSKAQLRYGNSP